MIDVKPMPWALLVEFAPDGAPRCDRTITLNGVTYRCARNPHGTGIHDANHVHPGDERKVRW